MLNDTYSNFCQDLPAAASATRNNSVGVGALECESADRHGADAAAAAGAGARRRGLGDAVGQQAHQARGAHALDRDDVLVQSLEVEHWRHRRVGPGRTML